LAGQLTLVPGAKVRVQESVPAGQPLPSPGKPAGGKP
jgi:hypothetical protein